MSDCLFCDIVDGKIKANLIYQDEATLAFKDIAPKAPVHILIIPRKHIVSVLDIDANDGAVIGQIFHVPAVWRASWASPRAAFAWWSIPAPMPVKACRIFTTIYSVAGR